MGLLVLFHRFQRRTSSIVATIGLIAGLMVPLALVAPQAAAATTAVEATPTWALLPEASPPPDLLDPSMAFDGSTNQMVLVGSVVGDGAEETWILSGKSQSWREVDTVPQGDGAVPNPVHSPPTRSQASLAYDVQHGALYLFGGLGGASGNQPLGDTWSWNGNIWINLTAQVCARAARGPDSRPR